MGIIAKAWTKRILPERLGIGYTKNNRPVVIHWTKVERNNETIYIGKTK